MQSKPQCGTNLTLGASGDTIIIPSGATILIKVQQQDSVLQEQYPGTQLKLQQIQTQQFQVLDILQIQLQQLLQ